MRQASLFLGLSAVLHVIGAVLTGFSGVGLFLLFPAALYAVLVVGLMRGLMIAAWIAFICMLGGSAGTVYEIFRPSSVPDWVLWSILAADLLAALYLFRAIWQGKPQT